MSYTGATVPIPLGALGLKTDDPQSSLPANALIKANNISLYSGKIEKKHGTIKYNSAPLSSAIVALCDWFPSPSLQRLIAVTADGKIFRDTGNTTFSSQTAVKTGLGAVTTDTSIAAGGAEDAGRNKKLFIATGASQIQVFSGDTATPANIALPATDWQSGNYPSFVIPYQGRMLAFGSSADRHRIYASFEEDHENFQGKAANPDLTNAQWELWTKTGSTTNVTATIQTAGVVTLFDTTNTHGFLLQSSRQFNLVNINITQPSAGSPTYTYEYWNGSSWVALTLTTTPVYSAGGATSFAFTIPTDWNPGEGSETAASGLYTLRILTPTASTRAIQINSMSLHNTVFDTFPYTAPVYPGEFDGLISAAVYRGLLFLFKGPQGVYILNGTDPDTNNWTIKKYSDAFGVSSPHSIVQVLGDLIAANSFGSYTSLQASDTSGDFEAGDVLANLSVLNYIDEQFNQDGVPFSQGIYYPHKRVAMFTAQSSSNNVRDRILELDVKHTPTRVYIDTKEQPNCLSLRKDQQGILRPMYGDQNGYVFLMDQDTYNVDGAAFLGEFQTPYIDFGFADPTLSEKNKIFDFLSVNYVATGNNNFYVDVYVDGSFRQTLVFAQRYGAALDAFTLDVDRLAGDAVAARNRKELRSCLGNKISFRFYNNSNNEAFMIEKISVGFRVSGEQVYGNQT